mgnify:CR=1 FL=1
MKKISIILLTLLFASEGYSQRVNSQDSLTIRTIYDMALLNGKSYDWLDYLSNNIGGRLSGTLNAEKAVQYTKEELDKLGLDKVWLQPVMVPKWVRGPKEFALIETQPGITFNVDLCALGGSVATPSVGIKSNVVEVKSFEELINKGVKLIFTVDCGTLSFDAIEYAKNNNIDVIVLDHHQSEIKLPNAFYYGNLFDAKLFGDASSFYFSYLGDVLINSSLLFLMVTTLKLRKSRIVSMVDSAAILIMIILL